MDITSWDSYGLGSEDDIADKIAANAKAQMEERMRKLEKLKLEEEEIEYEVREREDDLEKHIQKRRDLVHEQSQTMTQYLMTISNIEEEKETHINAIKKLDHSLTKLNEMMSDLEVDIDVKDDKLKIEEGVIRLKIKCLHEALEANSQARADLARRDLGCHDTTNITNIGGSSLVDFLVETIEQKEAGLQCPVCLEVAAVPILMCPLQHLICSNCRGQVHISRYNIYTD